MWWEYKEIGAPIHHWWTSLECNLIVSATIKIYLSSNPAKSLPVIYSTEVLNCSCTIAFKCYMFCTSIALFATATKNRLVNYGTSIWRNTMLLLKDEVNLFEKMSVAHWLVKTQPNQKKICCKTICLAWLFLVQWKLICKVYVNMSLKFASICKILTLKITPCWMGNIAFIPIFLGIWESLCFIVSSNFQLPVNEQLFGFFHFCCCFFLPWALCLDFQKTLLTAGYCVH